MSDGERQQLLLRQVRRQAAVVQRVAQKAGWGDTTPKDTGLGIATSFGQERNMPTSIGCVARVAADRRSGVVRVERLTIVVDAGTIVDPDGALAQIEGGALWASAWRSTKARNSSRGR